MLCGQVDAGGVWKTLVSIWLETSAGPAAECPSHVASQPLVVQSPKDEVPLWPLPGPQKYVKQWSATSKYSPKDRYVTYFLGSRY